MKNKSTYYILSILFLVAYLVVEFTDIYGDPGWFKAFVVILSISFLVGGLSESRKPDQ